MRTSFSLKIFYYTVLIILFLGIIIPLLWLVFLTFKTPQEFYLNPLSLPASPNFNNYFSGAKQSNIMQAFKNSFILTLGEIILTMLISVPAAFALARFDFKINSFLFSAFSLGVIIPPFTAIYPVFVVIKSLGLVNTHLGVIIPNSAFMISTSLILMVGHFKTFPKELEEAAFMDGANIWRLLLQIFIPISVPVLATCATFQFLGGWNDFVFPYILLNKNSYKPLTVVMSLFRGQYGTDYPGMAATVVMAIVPVLIAYCLLQKYVVDGMTAGAVKG